MMLLLVGVCATVALMLGGRPARKRQRLVDEYRREWAVATPRRHDTAELTRALLSRRACAGTAHFLDERTDRDLLLDQVFVALDRTRSTAGRDALYYRLRSFPSAAERAAFEALVERFSTDVGARERAALALARLQDPHGYDVWWLARPDVIESRGWDVVFPLAAAATAIAGVVTFVYPTLLPWLIGLVAVDMIVRFTAATRVVTVARALRQVAPLVATGEALSFLRGDDIAPLVGALPSAAKRLRRLKTVARWLGGDPLMVSFSSDLWDQMVTDLIRVVYEYLDIVFLLDATGVYFSADQLRSHGTALVPLLESLGHIDCALSVASWRAEGADWTRPHFLAPGATAVLMDLRHPLVERAVPNSITLPPGRGSLITGSNMSGKSTFIRTVGVNVLLAQTLNTCLASRYEAPVFRVRSCIGREDDLPSGKSYYHVEAEAMLGLVRASASLDPHLFLCDELFRGTNAVERVAAGEAVLTELVRQHGGDTPHAVLAATHDGELVDLLEWAFMPYHFSDRVSHDGLIFEYRLTPGPATTRNAIALLQQLGAASHLVTRAIDRAADLDRRRALLPH